MEGTGLSDSMNAGISETSKTGALPLGEEPTTVISFGKLLGISTVKEFKRSLMQSLESGLTIELDVSCVERVDTAALQLLYAFVRDSAASGRRLQWRCPTQVLIASAKLLRIHRLLALPDGKPETIE
jgi:ABC-type transporter Mla MlaB component